MRPGPSQTVCLLGLRLEEAKLRWQTIMASIDLGADKANIAVAETLCSAQPVRDGTAAVSPALLGCRRFYDLEPSLQRSCEDLSDVEDEIQRERHFLLATISALRRAAEAALDRAETAEVTALECLAAADAAEQSQAATLKQLQAAEKSHAMQQSIELRIRDSVTAEVHATISAVSQEATAELRAAVEEIRRLRADRSSSSSSSNDHSIRGNAEKAIPTRLLCSIEQRCQQPPHRRCNPLSAYHPKHFCHAFRFRQQVSQRGGLQPPVPPKIVGMRQHCTVPLQCQTRQRAQWPNHCRQACLSKDPGERQCQKG